jgi:hypothetical protein
LEKIALSNENERIGKVIEKIADEIIESNYVQFLCYKKETLIIRRIKRGEKENRD